MLVKARPAGFTDATLLLASELNTTDTEIVKALDGIGGGTYALAADINLTSTGCINHSGTTKWPKVGSRTVTVYRALIPHKLGSHWGVTAAAYAPDSSFVTSTVSSAYSVNGIARFLIPPLPAGLMTSMTFTLQGNASHAFGAVPTTQPRINFWAMTDGYMTTVTDDDSVYDTSATGTAYATEHSVVLTFASPRNTAGYYILDVDNEYGTSVFSGLKLSAFFKTDITVTEVKAQ